MDGLENVLFAMFTVLSLILLVVSLMAYRRSGRRKMLLLSAVFGAFLIKGILISIALFTEVMGMYELLLAGSGVDTIALMLLYLSTLRV